MDICFLISPCIILFILIFTRDLKKEGFKVKIEHKRGLLGLKPDNSEILEAKRLGISILSYPEALAKKIPGAIYLNNPKNLLKTLRELIILNSRFQIQDSVLVMMGAGTVVNYTVVTF